MFDPPLAAEFWVVGGGVAGIVSAVVAIIALVRGYSRGHHDRPPPAEPVSTSRPEPPSASTDPPLELKLSWMFPVHHDGSMDVPCVGLTVVNRLSHEVRWTSASIDLQDGSGRHMVLINTALPGMNLPLPVGPHDSNQTIVPAEQLRDNGFDLTRPITARASLATGETIVSNPWTAGH
jgi:hypothetical protein